ncbi:LuxR C-terminal-related transcriptional regulator [uncultured Tateyamaria sp.]|uniref:helix-turn-helix transcriptional regulator n=1 Tax=uncultured Tateyamaria sp. TaxID=455651 RepID=UPI002604CAD2|nr:LuxR C-terminal-related transcriptional regulator [uncultured Tateyamaria sp.]
MIDLNAATDRIFAARSIPMLRRTLFRLLRGLRFRRIAYIHAALGRNDYHFMDQVGFPRDFVVSYAGARNDPESHINDPFPVASRQCAFPVRWAAFTQSADLSYRHAAFVDTLRARGIGDGLSVHVAGPSGRDGYFALGYGRYGIDASAREMAHVQLICQAAHNMLCYLSPDGNRVIRVALSQREIEVLHWIAHGKSNSVIAEILGVSRHTVNTLCRRSFEKLGVSDRVSAVIIALRLGAIPSLSTGPVAQVSLT